jgi:GNAT superfamily N-acetyltransferase
MQSYDIRLLSASDLEGATRLSSAAGWNQRLEDWRLLVSLAPAASFAAVSEERIVATVIGIDYGRFSWIAMMLVDPDWRGRGIGRRLLNAAMEVVPADRPIRLDATPMGRPLSQSCGFEDEVLLTRHRSEAAPRASPPVAPRAQAFTSWLRDCGIHGERPLFRMRRRRRQAPVRRTTRPGAR